MNTELPDYLTTSELAELLRIKERKVYQMAASGKIPCTRATGKLLFPRKEVESWLEGKASQAFASLKNTWKTGNIRLKTMLRIFQIKCD